MNWKAIITAGVILLFTGTIWAQTASFTGTTLIGDAPGDVSGAGDFFGDHVASNSDWLMIGAPREDIDLGDDGLDPAQGDINVGALYVYKRTPAGPVLHQKIEGEGNNSVDPNAPGNRFGAGIVLQGNIMFVGVANDNNFPGLVDHYPDPYFDQFSFAGQVYVFNYDAGVDSWELVQKLTSDAPHTLGSFGARTNASHMELFSFGKNQADPTIALIGEVENNLLGLVAKLHVFKRGKKSNQWERIQIAEAPGGANTLFADAVEGVGNFALVTEASNDPGVIPDVVHVYRINSKGIASTRGNLLPTQTLIAPNGPSDCWLRFGTGLSASNGIAVIGDPCDSTAASNAGAVHVYKVNNKSKKQPLTMVQTLPNPSTVAETYFGSSLGNGKQTITTNGDLVLVGTPNDRIETQLPVEMFARDASGVFFPVQSILSPEPGYLYFELYGKSVTLLSDGQLAIGQMSPSTEELKGRVFLFDIQ